MDMLHSDPWMDVADTFPKVVVVAEENFVDFLEALVVGQKMTTKERNHLGVRLVATVVFWVHFELVKLGWADRRCTKNHCLLSDLAKQVLGDDQC
jgi:hypothetical protein